MTRPRTILGSALGLGLLAAAVAAPMPVQAGEGGGGSRQAAGGAHMSSYISDPYHDPRSLHSQRLGTGQILGAPMVYDRAGAVAARPRGIDPHWASGIAESRRAPR